MFVTVVETKNAGAKMNTSKLSNQSTQLNQFKQISSSHGNEALTIPVNNFVPGNTETDIRRAWLRSENILIPNCPVHPVHSKSLSLQKLFGLIF